jgi:hypothetical protein
MTPPRTIITSLTAAALMICIAIKFNACADNTPLQSTDEIRVDASVPFTMLKVLHPRLNKEFQRSKWIDEDGGSIWVGDEVHGYSSLYFPDDAVDDDVLVTFWWESTGFLEGGAEFSPHGITFDKPVRMQLSYKDADLTGVNEDDLKIFYYHEDTGEWEVIGDYVDKRRKVVVGYTTHFSRYGVGID